MTKNLQAIVEENTSSSIELRDTSISDNSNNKIDSENKTQSNEKTKWYMNTLDKLTKLYRSRRSIHKKSPTVRTNHTTKSLFDQQTRKGLDQDQ